MLACRKVRLDSPRIRSTREFGFRHLAKVHSNAGPTIRLRNETKSVIIASALRIHFVSMELIHISRGTVLRCLIDSKPMPKQDSELLKCNRNCYYSPLLPSMAPFCSSILVRDRLLLNTATSNGDNPSLFKLHRVHIHQEKRVSFLC